MTRVKGAVHALKRRRNVLKMAKGYQFGRSTKEKQAKEALFHAGNHAFNDRRKKKGNFRSLWNIRINAAVRPHGMSYSRFIDALTKKDIQLDRKTLSTFAMEQPEVFERIVNEVKDGTPAKKVAEKQQSEPKKKTASASKADAKPDDLTKVEGIGPKISETLIAAGVTTFAKLSKTDAAKISEIITDVRGNHVTDTWPKQAELAAEGKWDELKKWQDELDGGK